MKRIYSHPVLFTAVSLTLMIFLCGTVCSAQEKTTEINKIYAEIVGDYEFDIEGEMMIFNVKLEEGKLIATPEGEDSEELEPVEGESLKFEVNTADGEHFILEFIRDESGKITKLKAINEAIGMEIEGKKIK
jgi:hypothetical protein